MGNFPRFLSEKRSGALTLIAAVNSGDSTLDCILNSVKLKIVLMLIVYRGDLVSQHTMAYIIYDI